MANYLVGITLKATDQASAIIAGVRKPLSAMQVGMKAAADGTRDFDNKWGALAGTATRVGMGIAAVGTAGLALGAHFTKLAGQMQSAQKSFTNLLHSSGLAKRFIADLQTFGAQTPFEFMGLQSMSKQLLAFGFSARSIIPMLRSVGDAMSALGGGEEGVQRVVEGLGRIQAKGKMTARELMNMASTGVPVFQILQDELGLTAEEVGKIGLVGLSSDKAIKALLAGMDKRFGGAMEAQSKTLSGALSNLKDTLDITSAGLGAGLVAPATMGVRALTGLINVVRQLPAPLQMVIGTGMTGLAGLTLALGLGIIGFVKFVEGMNAARAAMLAFGETEVGMMVASKAMIALNWLQTLSVDGVVASLTAQNAAMAATTGGVSVLAAGQLVVTAATWAWEAAEAALAVTLNVVSASARIMWAAIKGPIGWIIGAIAAVGGIIYGLVAANRAAKKAAEERSAADVEGAAAATEADKKAQEAKAEAADAAEKAKDAAIDLADAEKAYQRAVEDEPRIARDTANEVRNAKEAQAEATQGIIDQEREAAESIADAQKDIVDAHKEAEKAANDGARGIVDAQAKVIDATDEARERVESATDAVAKAYRTEQKAAESLADAKVKGQQRVDEAEERAADRQKSAQKRLDDLLKKQAGIEESPEEKMARDIQEARDELAKSTAEGQKAIDEAKKQAAADELAAQEALANAQAETKKAADEARKAVTEGQKAIADAEIALKDARVAAAEAEQKAAERVNAAEKSLNETRADNEKAKIDAAKRLRDATEAYVRAAEQAPLKLQDAADAIAKAARALENAKAASAEANKESEQKAEKANPEDIKAELTRQVQRNRGTFGLNFAAQGRNRAEWNETVERLKGLVGEEKAQQIIDEAIANATPRAGGGAISAGRLYMVGERGPELFSSGTSGRIIPGMVAPQSLAGAGVVNNNTFNFNGPAYGDQYLQRMIEEGIERVLNGSKYATP